MTTKDLADTVDNISKSHDAVRWSIAVLDEAGDFTATVNPDLRCATASIGKVLLLVEAASQIDAGILSSTERLSRSVALAVQDSGIWQHLQLNDLSVDDCICLLATSSDNLATNVLLKRIGLARVSDTAAALGLTSTALDDFVRNFRGPEHPDALSHGTAGELAVLMSRLSQGEIINTTVSQQVLAWLSLNHDLSMVAGAFGLDPLAHVEPDRGFVLHNKTGTNDGVRCDVGVVRGPTETVSYAVLANWDRTDDIDAERDAVLESMTRIGAGIRALVTN